MPSHSRLPTRTPNCRRLVLAVGIALFARLFGVAHDVSHLANPPHEGTASRHCVVCSIDNHAPAIPVAAPPTCGQANLWFAIVAGPQATQTGVTDSGGFARAPPLAAAPDRIG